MLAVNQISKTYQIETILNSVSFTLQKGERWGLVGPNGCGKTTLLRIITGSETADKGSVSFTPSNLRVGYLPQGFDYPAGETISTFINRMEGDINLLTLRLEELASALAEDPGQPDLQLEYDTVLERISLASENTGNTTSVLHVMGLAGLDGSMPVQHLSGGQKTRLALAGVLLSSPELLILDEPTNHLDISILEWLEDWLSKYPYAALIVSHDRMFLDRTVTGILELDGMTHAIKSYEGNYSTYIEAKTAEQERAWQSYQGQQDEIARLKSAAGHYRGLSKFRKGGKADTGDKFAKGFFANRGKETMNRAKSVERRLETLMTEEHIEKPRAAWQMFIQFAETDETSRNVLVTEDLSIGYDGKPLLEEINLQLKFGQRVALIGPNGSGKSTFIKTMIGKLPPIAGSLRLGTNVKIGYMPQEHDNLVPQLNPLTTIQSIMPLNDTEARSFLSLYLFKGDDVFTPNDKLSYGEKARLSLACLVVQGNNFLILDEPINHLDIPSRTRFEQAMSRFPGTILAVVHDRYFINNYANEVWEVQSNTIRWREHL